jgi:type IX secretion system PorP/SprF family membrane protein
MKQALTLVLSAACCVLVYIPQTKAQDYHLSQYDIAPLYMNPALAGMYLGEKGDFRVLASYRSQWQRLQSKPYTTSSIAFDKPMKRFGIGGYLIDNLAGISNYSSFGFVMGAAYRITSPKSKNHFLSTGLQLGLINKKYSENDLLFTNQYYASSGLNPNAPTGENFQKASILKMDVNMGIYYKYKNEFKTFNPFFGVSLSHINKPNQSTTGIEYRLPIRYNVTIGTDIYISPVISLQPIFLAMYQGAATEFSLGMMEYYHINANYQLVSGIGYRYQDAVIIQLGIKQGPSTFRISYDVITSPLKAYAGMRGAVEMGVIYTGIGKNRGRG